MAQHRMTLQRWVLTGLVAVGLLLAGCTGGGPADPGTAAGSAGSAVGVTGPPSTVDAPGLPGASTIACAHAIDVLDAPPTDRVVVAGLVAVPGETVLQAAPSGDDGPVRLFAKSGLVVRADAVVELRVQASPAVQPWIGWGSSAQPARQVRLTGCPDRSGWLVFAGGYWVDQPACVPLTVRAGDREEQVWISVGARCPN